MDADGVNAVIVNILTVKKVLWVFDLPLDLETSLLKTLNVVPERSRSIGTTENVLVQVQTPDEILVLPSLTKTRQLNIHSTIIIQHIVALTEETSKTTDTNMLAHLQLGNLIELLLGNITVVHAENTALLISDTSLLQSIIAPRSLVLSNSNTSNLSTVVQRSEAGQSTPATANIQHGLALLEADFLAHNSHLVILHFFQSLLLLGVGDHTGGVDHAGAEEPGVVVVAAVVVRTDLLLVLGLGVEDDVDEEGEDDELEQVHGEGEVGPVVAVLQDLQDVTVELDLAVQVHLSEGLQGDLVTAAPSGLVFGALEGDVVFDGTTGQLHLLVCARAEGGGKGPVGDQQGEDEDEGKEEPGLLATAEETGDESGNTDEDGCEEVVGEALVTGAVGGERCIVDSRGLFKSISHSHTHNGHQGNSGALESKQMYAS